ncbi:MAG: SMC-Scp complex subunit ScpB [Planctomycetes bacterium]|nr:SMC-Scp complex subunit ScpB [Planctomycetota bacterium]
MIQEFDEKAEAQTTGEVISDEEQDKLTEEVVSDEEQAQQTKEVISDDQQDKQTEEAEIEPLEQLEIEESQQADEQPLTETPEDFEVTIESVVEAVLFASDEPLTVARLSKIVETTTKQVRDSVKSLNEKYTENKNAFRIEQIAGGFQMLTLSPFNNWLRKLLRARDESKLSPAALETLAIIAYKQPLIRVDIETIRGVAAGEMVRSLMYKGLVKIVGRAEVLGRPMLYGTTKKFLEVFGLNTLKDLPKIEELKKPNS